MNRYEVVINFDGTMSFEIEAESEDDARDEAEGMGFDADCIEDMDTSISFVRLVEEDIYDENLEVPEYKDPNQLDLFEGGILQ